MGSKKILLIEDDPDHAELIIDVLRTENVKKEIILLKDGLEALDYLQKIDIDGNGEIRSQIDLVILDLNLPKVKGMDVLKFLKNNSRYSSIPVVVLSTSTDHDTIETAYKNGVNSYITKPISYEGFVEKIRTLSIYC
ncbi:MAG: response regulator [Candidatus Scalindua sediminis]